MPSSQHARQRWIRSLMEVITTGQDRKMISVDCSDENSPTADPPTLDRLPPGSNLTFEQFGQSLKQNVPIAATEEGIQSA
jgi:hypothetical protein